MRHAAVAGCIALAVAMGIGRFAFTPLLPMMQDDQNVSVAAGGWLASANYLGYLVGALGAVWMRVRAETMIRTSLALIGMVTLAMPLTDSFGAWLSLRFVAGLLSAWVLISASAWALSKITSSLAGIVFAGVGTGIALAGLVCLVLMQLGTGSGQAWIVMATLAFALTLVIWRIFEHGQSGAPGQAPALGMNDPASLRLILCYGASGFGYIIPATFLPVMAKAAVADPLVFGWSWPLFGLASAAATFAAGTLMRRLGSRRVWLWSHALMAVGVVTPLAWPGVCRHRGVFPARGRHVHGQRARRLCSGARACGRSGEAADCRDDCMLCTRPACRTGDGQPARRQSKRRGGEPYRCRWGARIERLGHSQKPLSRGRIA
jgi:MFS family permease